MTELASVPSRARPPSPAPLRRAATLSPAKTAIDTAAAAPGAVGGAA